MKLIEEVGALPGKMTHWRRNMDALPALREAFFREQSHS